MTILTDPVLTVTLGTRDAPALGVGACVAAGVDAGVDGGVGVGVDEESLAGVAGVAGGSRGGVEPAEPGSLMIGLAPRKCQSARNPSLATS